MSRQETNGGDFSSPGSTRGGSDGNGHRLHDYRLKELERRVGDLETRIGGINDLCIEIRTKLDNVATKGFVWMVFAGTLTLAVLTMLGHVMLRYIE